MEDPMEDQTEDQTTIIDRAFARSGRHVAEIDGIIFRVIELVARRDHRGDVDLVCIFDDWPGTEYARQAELVRLGSEVARLLEEARDKDITINELRLQLERLVGHIGAEQQAVAELRSAYAMGEAPAGDLVSVEDAEESAASQVEIAGMVFTEEAVEAIAASIRRDDTKTATLKLIPGFASSRYREFSDVYNAIKAMVDQESPA